MAQQPRSGTSHRFGPIWGLAPYGAFGAVLPSICAIASRSEAFTFTPDLNVFVGQVIYIAAAAFLSTIFPLWKDSDSVCGRSCRDWISDHRWHRGQRGQARCPQSYFERGTRRERVVARHDSRLIGPLLTS
jgi:hypothetical protein